MADASTSMLVLTESQVKACLTVSLALQASSHAFYTAAHNTSTTPPRLILTLPPLSPSSPPLHTLFKPSLTPTSLGLKVVSVRPSNSAHHLPTVPASILLISPLTGLPLTTLSATHLTAARTAAGSAIATQLFASPTARTLGIFGAGLQAEAHAHAVLAVRRSIRTVHILNRSAARAHSLIERLQSTHPTVTFQATLIAEGDAAAGPSHELLLPVVSACDVVCLCTNASRPLLLSSMVSAGCHVNAVGSYTADSREMDSALVRRAKVVVDDEGAWGSGDLAQPLKEGVIQRDHVQGVLGEYLSHHFAHWPPVPEAHTVHEEQDAEESSPAPPKVLRTSTESARGTRHRTLMERGGHCRLMALGVLCLCMVGR